MWQVVLSFWECVHFAVKAMKRERLHSSLANICSGFSWYDKVYTKCDSRMAGGSKGKLKMVLVNIQGHGLLQMWNNNARQSDSSGLKAQETRFSLCWVSTWFSMLVEEWGLCRPPLLKVFHRGESSDLHSIQRVCCFCLWRRWNTVLCFTTIGLIDIADFSWFWDVTTVQKYWPMEEYRRIW